jgi:SAM-dependent methyltransferase
MNSRMLRFEIGGQNLSTFSVEDLLIMLCVHGAKHFWERLSWIVDIAQLITVREVNWVFLLESSAKMESTRLLLLGLYLAHKMIDATLPQFVMDRCRGDKNVIWLAEKVMEAYAGDAGASAGIWPRAIFRFRSSDRYWSGLRQLVRLIARPTESDRQNIQLPGFLHPLYTILRPVRLVKKYGLGLANRRAKPDLAAYVPTPLETVEKMLCLAEVGSGDVLYDLGCGDGRIVIAAAKQYGVRAVGIDVDPLRIAEARANARNQGVDNRVQFILGDAKKSDFREATVITMYLGADGNLRLLDRLRSLLRPGTRIVSRDFLIYGWDPERTETYGLPNGDHISLYLWTIKSHEPVTQGTRSAISGASSSR